MAALPMRKLAAIMAADVVGFSRQMGADETGTLRRLGLAREQVIDPLIAAHYGRIFKVMGDGILAEFPSAVLALRCAVEIQTRLDAENAPRPAEARIVLRIGLHQGDVVVEGTDLLGDGVNVAARLEPMAEPGGICVSHRVHEDAAGKLVLAFEDLGERSLKNIFNPIRVHRVRLTMQTVHANPPETAARPEGRQAGRPVIAVLPFERLGGVAEAHAHIATGLAEDIITALSRLRWLSVVPRNSSFSQSAGGDLRRVARDLGARYLVTGSVRQSGDRVRVSAQLIDSASGEQVWADRHESLLAEVFDIQDRVAQLVSAAVGEMLSPNGIGAGDEGLRTVVRRAGLIHSVTVSGVEPTRRMTIGPTPLTVGRMSPSQILLAGNEVSRAHCRLALTGSEVVVTDLGSTNGTFVDGGRIAGPVTLAHGATIRIGPHLLIYECSATDRDATGVNRAQETAPPGGDHRENTFRN